VIALAGDGKEIVLRSPELEVARARRAAGFDRFISRILSIPFPSDVCDDWAQSGQLARIVAGGALSG
jgi:hypothetical protein